MRSTKKAASQSERSTGYDNVLTETDPLGSNYHLFVHARERPLLDGYQRPGRRRQSFTYNDRGQILTVTDSRGDGHHVDV